MLHITHDSKAKAMYINVADRMKAGVRNIRTQIVSDERSKRRVHLDFDADTGELIGVEILGVKNVNIEEHRYGDTWETIINRS